MAQVARTIVERHPTPTIVLTPDGRIALWNAAAGRLYGFSRGEAVGRPIEELIAPVSLRERLHAESVRAGGLSFVVLTLPVEPPDRSVRPPAAAAAVPIAALTRRQREVLVLLAAGSRSKEIAKRLGVSLKTVEAHRGQIMDRLGIHDIAGLVRFAIRMGLVPRDR